MLELISVKCFSSLICVTTKTSPMTLLSWNLKRRSVFNLFNKCNLLFLTTIKHLQDKIQSVFQIVPEMQRIFDSNDRRIDLLVGSLEDAGIRDNETFILVSYLTCNSGIF